ncbi:uncharacterized protein V1518DRAFT_416287 [Limtongia smithiae]|uniref:uncharacterized protein n=1 Tax=Limtongia smithiae TaxID=1125753 RepID=UPI0034CE9461
MPSSIVRSIKNVTNGYTSAQVKVRNATSNEPWGPTSAEMDEIAQMTYDRSLLFEIMEIVDRRLNDKGKNWNHVYKALILLDYCIRAGSEDTVRWAKDNIYMIKTLREFVHVDEEGRDQGQAIRTKAKELTTLLRDDDSIRTARARQASIRDRIGRPGSHGGGAQDDTGFRRQGPAAVANSARERPERRPRRANTTEDDEMRRAIAESKVTAREDEARRQARGYYSSGSSSPSSRPISATATGTLTGTATGTVDNGPSLIELDDKLPQQPTGYVPQQVTGFMQQPTGLTQQAYTTGYPPPQQQQLYTGAGFQMPAPTGIPAADQAYYQQQYALMQQQQQLQLQQQQTGMPPQATGQLASDFTGAGFGGYSAQQQQPNAFHSSLQPIQTGYVTQFPQQTGYAATPQQYTGMYTQQTGFAPQYTAQQQPYQPQTSSPLAPQPTGRNNPFARPQ